MIGLSVRRNETAARRGPRGNDAWISNLRPMFLSARRQGSLVRWVFLASCAAILLATLLLKLVFLHRNAVRAGLNPLLRPDPVLAFLTKGAAIRIAAGIEAVVICLCACPLAIAEKARLLLITSYVFFSYHLVSDWAGGGPCGCLGGDWKWLATHYLSVNCLLYGSLLYMGLGSAWILWTDRTTASGASERTNCRRQGLSDWFRQNHGRSSDIAPRP